MVLNCSVGRTKSFTPFANVQIVETLSIPLFLFSLSHFIDSLYMY